MHFFACGGFKNVFNIIINKLHLYCYRLIKALTYVAVIFLFRAPKICKAASSCIRNKPPFHNGGCGGEMLLGYQWQLGGCFASL